jgi:hypothetical protein
MMIVLPSPQLTVAPPLGERDAARRFPDPSAPGFAGFIRLKMNRGESKDQRPCTEWIVPPGLTIRSKDQRDRRAMTEAVIS